jgi:pyruvate,water dikinase
MKSPLLIPLLLTIILLLNSCSTSTPENPKEQDLTDVNDEGLQTMDEYYSLASTIDIPGLFNQKSVKFLISGANTATPRFDFVDANLYSLHWEFYESQIENGIPRSEFDSKAYFAGEDREVIPGQLLYYEYFTTGDHSGIFTMEFWPTDTLSSKTLVLAYSKLREQLQIPDAELRYHPKGISQELSLSSNDDEFIDELVPNITTDELFGQFSFIPFNNGESYGILRKNSGDGVDFRDIVLFDEIPNTLSHVSGIITSIPQTPLSHINLIAKQNNIPNAYIRDAFSSSKIASLIDKYVHFIVRDSEYILEEATEEDVNKYFDDLRPESTQIPTINNDEFLIKKFEDISFEEANVFGSKTTNIAELGRILPNGAVPEGVGISFAYYLDFFVKNNLNDSARVMMEDPLFKSDLKYREERLTSFRQLIESSPLETKVVEQFETAIRGAFAAGTSLRCRSSTNSEDLEGFSGAGLYNSYTHKADEGVIANTIKQVWAGVWNYRAYEERSFYRIDHLKAAAGVLVHPNFENEKSNGVAVTRNIYNFVYGGFYVNVQRDEMLVTNPDAHTVPEEFTISKSGSRGEYEVEYIRYSNIVPDGEKILDEQNIDTLINYMELIQAHFKKMYNSYDDKFAMEIEFKVDEDDQLVIKQARPWK